MQILYSLTYPIKFIKLPVSNTPARYNYRVENFKQPIISNYIPGQLNNYSEILSSSLDVVSKNQSKIGIDNHSYNKLGYKILGASLILISIGSFIIRKYRREVRKLKDKILVSAYNNKRVFISCLFFVGIMLVVVLILLNNSSQKRYNSLCQEIAKSTYKSMIHYFEKEIEEHQVYHLEEDKLISILSNVLGVGSKTVVDDIYNPYLRLMLQGNRNLTQKELVYEGEIKIFWVYDLEFAL